MAQLSQLYFSFLGETPRAVTPGVCFCCKTALGVRRDGAVLIAWRHVYPGNMRDIAFTISRDRGRSFSAPVRVSEDRWSIAGCPDDGPSLALDAADRAHVIWPTVVVESGEPVKALFHAMTADGQTFTPRVRLPSLGHANHPQLTVADDGTLIAAWDEAIDGRRRIARARGAIDAAGQVTFVREAAIPSGVYPHLAATGEGVVTAWTSGAPAASVIRVAR